MARTVIVTGAHGFLGRHVCRFYAQNGWEVAGIGHGSFTEDEKRAWGIGRWISAEVTIEGLKGCAPGGPPEVVVHCAGGSSVGASIADPYSDFCRTALSTVEVLEFARLVCPEAKIVYPSSAAVYGAAEKLPIREDSALMPLSPYGVNKKIAEDLCLSYSRQFSIRCAVVRLFSVYGEGLRKQLLWESCGKLKRNEMAFWGTGKETRDWLHADDAASLIYAAGQKATPKCPVVNGGSGQATSVEAVLNALFRAFGRADGPEFNGLFRPGDPAHYQADITRARGWGWAPKTGLDEGIRRYAQWYMAL